MVAYPRNQFIMALHFQMETTAASIGAIRFAVSCYLTRVSFIDDSERSSSLCP
jgi:hypothetical protein